MARQPRCAIPGEPWTTSALVASPFAVCGEQAWACEAWYNVGMAVVVGIHGIAQQFRGGYQLEDVWFNGIRDGLVAAGHPQVAGSLASGDVRVAFFGDLFRKPGTMAAGDPPYSAADVQRGVERDLLAVLFEAAVAQEPSLGAPAGAMGPGRAAVQVMLNRLSRSKTFSGFVERAFIKNLKQVSGFLTDPGVKQNVLARVQEQISGDTRVVIGHSLGSVVAYEYLCHDRPSSVELLITLGSPLGIANVVFDRLTPAPAGGAGAWPGGVAGWVNVADPDDIVALRKDLAPLFPGAIQGQEVVDRLVDNGGEPHAIDRYLNTRQTGSALSNALS
jgi:PGAP1-like protein